MHILVAPNAFKNSATAEVAAAAICRGLRQSNLKCTCESFPIGDGGDGTASLVVKKRNGKWISGDVQNALGKTIHASFGLIDNGATAVIEMANAAGLRLLQPAELNPLRATSFGTGQQIKASLDKGVKNIIIGMGGSATVDGGVGILKALGIRFLDGAGEELTDLPEGVQKLASIDLSVMDTRIFATRVTVFCDVDNRLLGEQGSAAVFGPQKGASPQAVQKLEAALEKFAEVVFKQTGKDIRTIKYGGTAGGAAAGLYALINAQLVNGIDHFLELTAFDSSLEKADLVITGEGSIDEQTLQGKGPFGVAFRAKQKAVPVVALAGKVPVVINQTLKQYFDAIIPIAHEPLDLPAALAATENNLTRTAEMIGNLLAVKNDQKL